MSRNTQNTKRHDKSKDNLGGIGRNNDASRHSDPTAPSFSKKNLMGCWKNIGTQANDNPDEAKRSFRLMQVFTFFFLFVATLTFNSSAIVSYVALHSNDVILSTAMDVSPNAVAFMLNQINIGE